MTDISDIRDYPELLPHPCAELFPAMDDEPFKALVADLNENGLREPIVVDQHNRIVDGLNRYRACIELGIRPKIERRTLTDTEALKLTVSRNFHRRNLTPSQLAAIAAEIANRKRGGNQAANLPDVISQAEAATIMQTSERAVRSAAKVKRLDPRLHEEVKAGKISLHAAEHKVVEKHGRPKSLKKGFPLTTPQGDNDVAAIPGTYAPLFAELDALPHYLNDHPLSAHHAAELDALLTRAIESNRQAQTTERKTA